MYVYTHTYTSIIVYIYVYFFICMYTYIHTHTALYTHCARRLGRGLGREVGGWGRVPLERWGAGVDYHFQEI